MKRKTNETEPTTDLRPTIRLLVLLAFFKLAVIIGIVVVISQLSSAVDNQAEQIQEQNASVESIKAYTDSLQTDEATKAQQVVLYKIFLGMCEGRFASNTPSAKLDPSIEACAERLFLSSPQLPGDAQVLPGDTNNNR